MYFILLYFITFYVRIARGCKQVSIYQASICGKTLYAKHGVRWLAVWLGIPHKRTKEWGTLAGCCLGIIRIEPTIEVSWLADWLASTHNRADEWGRLAGWLEAAGEQLGTAGGSWEQLGAARGSWKQLRAPGDSWGQLGAAGSSWGPAGVAGGSWGAAG